jgi:hypothetical protein
MFLGISSKDIQKARQNAKRKRTSVACAPCKAAKTKCSEYRPCQKCLKSDAQVGCVDNSVRSAKSGPSHLSSSIHHKSQHTHFDEQAMPVSAGRQNDFYQTRHCTLDRDEGQRDHNTTGQMPNLLNIPDELPTLMRLPCPWIDDSMLGPHVASTLLMGSGYPLQNQPQQHRCQALHYSGPCLPPITPVTSPVPQLTAAGSPAGQIYSQPFLSQPPALRLLLGLAALAAPSTLQPLQYHH